MEVTYCYHRPNGHQARLIGVDYARALATVEMTDGTVLKRRLTSFMYRGVTLHAALAFGVIGGEV